MRQLFVGSRRPVNLLDDPATRSVRGRLASPRTHSVDPEPAGQLLSRSLSCFSWMVTASFTQTTPPGRQISGMIAL